MVLLRRSWQIWCRGVSFVQPPIALMHKVSQYKAIKFNFQVKLPPFADVFKGVTKLFESPGPMGCQLESNVAVYSLNCAFKIGFCWHSFSPGVYNLLLLQAALLLFMWSTAANEFELYLWDTAKYQPTQNIFKHKLRIHSITLCAVTIQIVTHRVDWFSWLASVLLQIRQHGRQILYFKLHVDGRKFHYRRPQVVRRCFSQYVKQLWVESPWQKNNYTWLISPLQNMSSHKTFVTPAELIKPLTHAIQYLLKRYAQL